MPKSCPINALFQMSKFGIMLYLVSNLPPCIAFIKFNVKFGIALENIFYAKMPNFNISTQFWHCIRDALTKVLHFLDFSQFKL